VHVTDCDSNGQEWTPVGDIMVTVVSTVAGCNTGGQGRDKPPSADIPIEEKRVPIRHKLEGATYDLSLSPGTTLLPQPVPLENFGAQCPVWFGRVPGR
jgi:hypothetical protein